MSISESLNAGAFTEEEKEYLAKEEQAKDKLDLGTSLMRLESLINSHFQIGNIKESINNQGVIDADTVQEVKNISQEAISAPIGYFTQHKSKTHLDLALESLDNYHEKSAKQILSEAKLILGSFYKEGASVYTSSDTARSEKVVGLLELAKDLDKDQLEELVSKWHNKLTSDNCTELGFFKEVYSDRAIVNLILSSLEKILNSYTSFSKEMSSLGDLKESNSEEIAVKFSVIKEHLLQLEDLSIDCSCTLIDNEYRLTHDIESNASFIESTDELGSISIYTDYRESVDKSFIRVNEILATLKEDNGSLTRLSQMLEEEFSFISDEERLVIVRCVNAFLGTVTQIYLLANKVNESVTAIDKLLIGLFDKGGSNA